MTEVLVDLNNIEYDPRIEEILKEEMRKAFDAGEEMAVEVDCPYAQYVEFGSDKATATTSTKVRDLVCGGEKITAVNLKIREWVSAKYFASPKERKKRGDNIYKKIMKEGMKASPFIRPAKYIVLEDVVVHPEKYLVPGGNVTEKIAQAMKIEMENALMQNESIITKDLFKSIRVVNKSEVEGDDVPLDLKDIKPEIWADEHLDRHGNYIKPRNCR